MEKLDAIVILGWKHDSDKLSEISIERLTRVLELYTKHTIPIICSGWYFGGFKEPPKQSEAELMKNWLVEHNVPESDILLEENSKDTGGNAYFSKQIVKEKGWNNLIIVCSDFNLKRAKYIFNLVFGPNYTLNYIGVLCKHIPYDLKREEQSLKIAQFFGEKITLGDDVAMGELLWTKHPLYAKNSPYTLKDLKDMVQDVKD